MGNLVGEVALTNGIGDGLEKLGAMDGFSGAVSKLLGCFCKGCM
jgi:hypothetical protein